MSQTADQPSADRPGTSRRTATRRRWPSRSSSAWQDRWEAEGTFHTPNPTGPAERGLREGRRPAQVLRDGHVPVPLGRRAARRAPAGLPGHRRHQPVPPHGRRQRAAPDGLRRLRPARRAVRRPDRAAPADHHRGQHRGHPRAAAPAGCRPRRPPVSFATIDPGYYKWTQWIFLQIFGSWFDESAGKARRIEELVAELDAGTRAARAGDQPARAGRGPSWTTSSGARSSTRTGWPTCTRRRSTGARGWAPCCPTRRSPPTGAPSAATSRCSGVR